MLMLKRLFFSLLLIPAVAVPADLCAQVVPDRGTVPGWELYGGYSYVFRPYDHTQSNPFSGGMNGWDASLKIPVPIVGSWLGAKGEVSGVYRNDAPSFNPNTYFFLLGPQISVHLGRSTVFIDGLVGSSHLDNSALPNLRSDNTFAVAAGGGVDIGLSRYMAWRLGADYYNTNYQSTNNNIHEIVNSNARATTGLVLRF